jgi:1-hydroxycarotenoid 3,4-desaturase
MANSNDQHVVVIGAGVAGLTAAVQLACSGVQVTVLERAHMPGGKMRQVTVDGAAIDSGPTVFTMRWVFDELFAHAGASLDDYVWLQPLSILARHAWSASQQLDLYADKHASAEAIGRFSGAAESRRFLRFCDQAKQVYQALETPYIRSEKPSLARMVRDLGPRGIVTLSALGPFATLWQNLARQFSDPRLQQLFGRYATYTGSSPWLAPATLMLIAQVEMNGVWSVRGGMHALASALERLGRVKGVRYTYGAHVQRINVVNGRAAGVTLANGETIAADSVVYNGDAGALAQALLGDAARGATDTMPARARSLSALTWSINAVTHGFDLSRHNVFFQPNYAGEFDDIFRLQRLPQTPTVYLCAQDRGEGAGAVQGAERLLCLVNAPAIGDVRQFEDKEIAQCEQNSFAMLRRYGLMIDRQIHNTVLTTPQDFHRLFPGTGGALYGRAMRGWMDTFRRPCSESQIPGLYLAGGGAHPGPGVPMAAMSGRLAAETLLARLHSTNRSRRVVISGGTSTRSAMMASMG